MLSLLRRMTTRCSRGGSRANNEAADVEDMVSLLGDCHLGNTNFMSTSSCSLSSFSSNPPPHQGGELRACGHGEAIFFQANAHGEEGMTLFFACCNLPALPCPPMEGIN
ncbi:hypothetical protein E2562_017954 [Oryza meyeriana var. granulata]|nr:hypothetical protein E2562_017954 [Oryza meyeriana var. granulata]